MPFWIDPLWFGRQASSGGTRLPVISGVDLGVPVHTRLIEVLAEELPGVEVWPDIDQSEGPIDSVVVRATGGEWLTQSNSWQQMNRTFQIIGSSATSDGAERLADQIAIVIKRRRDAFRLISASTMAGGYEPESQTYYRGLDATFRGRK